MYRPNIPHDFEIALEIYHLVSLVEKCEFYVIALTAFYPNSISYKLCTCLIFA